jgi:hypothetical protein
MMSFVVLALVLPALAAAAPFPACCAYGGKGAAVVLGAGSLNAFPPAPGGVAPSGPVYAAPMAVGVSPSRSFSAILFGAETGPEDAAAGWIVTSNKTHDVIFVFANMTAGAPTCQAGVAPRGTMVGEYALCAGSGLFPTFDHAFSLATLAVGAFTQTAKSTTMSFGGDATECAPVSLLGNYSPFGTGSWSINFESGEAVEPPASWSAPPSYCDGRWAEAAPAARAL